MKSFYIQREDPKGYKEMIFKFWEEYLPGTPFGRLSWMTKGNPSGQAIWFFAFEKRSKNLAGTLSIMPRRVSTGGRRYLSGIVGDIMVAKEYRNLGVGLQLMNTALQTQKELGFDFFYIFPNELSKIISLRAGFRSIGFVKRLARPLNLRKYLKKYLPSLPAHIISLPLNLVLRLISKETYANTNLLSSQISEPQGECDLFIKKIENKGFDLGERGAEYFKWRYFENPHHNFKMMVYKKGPNADMLGYTVFTEENNNIHVFDMLAVDAESFEMILGKFVREITKKNFDSISVDVYEFNPFYSCFKSFGFHEREDQNDLLFVGDNKFLPKQWVFFDGDRNL